jgi:hypothetical protein
MCAAPERPSVADSMPTPTDLTVCANAICLTHARTHGGTHT